MPRRRASPAEPSEFVLPLTPNQVVAYNLAQARGLREWTQDEAAAALEPYLGVRWSKGTFSAAERSVDGGRVRQFTADEIVAFARAFELPVSWFFMPPMPWRDGFPVVLQTADGGPSGVTPSELVDVVFGNGEQQAILNLRLQAYLEVLGIDRLTDAQTAIAGSVSDRVEQIVGHSLGRLSDAQDMLRGLANHLEDIGRQARRAALDDERKKEAPIDGG